ncbi:MAG: hypothetical protein ACRD1S_18630, partial [Vicinamibacterales bacterium]
MVTASAAVAQPSRMQELDRTGDRAVQPYVRAHLAALEGGLPSNLLVPPAYQTLVETMWLRSPTFRRQCARIAGATRLTVVVSCSPSLGLSGSRAETRVFP